MIEKSKADVGFGTIRKLGIALGNEFKELERFARAFLTY